MRDSFPHWFLRAFALFRWFTSPLNWKLDVIQILWSSWWPDFYIFKPEYVGDGACVPESNNFYHSINCPSRKNHRVLEKKRNLPDKEKLWYSPGGHPWVEWGEHQLYGNGNCSVKDQIVVGSTCVRRNHKKAPAPPATPPHTTWNMSQMKKTFLSNDSILFNLDNVSVTV